MSITPLYGVSEKIRNEFVENHALLRTYRDIEWEITIISGKRKKLLNTSRRRNLINFSFWHEYKQLHISHRYNAIIYILLCTVLIQALMSFNKLQTTFRVREIWCEHRETRPSPRVWKSLRYELTIKYANNSNYNHNHNYNNSVSRARADVCFSELSIDVERYLKMRIYIYRHFSHSIYRFR